MATENLKTNHVFISYVSENSGTVDQLEKDLLSFGIKVWVDRNDIAPGSRWKTAIREAINKGAFFIACFSKEYNDRERSYMNEELNLAIEELRLRSPDTIWFIPVLLSKCEIPDFSIGASEKLRDIQWVDLSNNWKKGIQRIAATIKSSLTKEKIDYSLLESLDNVEIEVLRSMYQFFGTKMFTIEDVRNRTFYTERLSRTLYNHMIRGLIDKNFNEKKNRWQYCLPAFVITYLKKRQLI